MDLEQVTSGVQWRSYCRRKVQMSSEGKAGPPAWAGLQWDGKLPRNVLGLLSERLGMGHGTALTSMNMSNEFFQALDDVQTRVVSDALCSWKCWLHSCCWIFAFGVVRGNLELYKDALLLGGAHAILRIRVNDCCKHTMERNFTLT